MNIEIYDKQTWENLPSQETPITAERLNHIEDGIEGNSNNSTTLEEAINRNYEVSNLDEDDYDSTRTYSVGDMVIYNHGIYECIQTSTGNIPTNTNYWSLVPIIEEKQINQKLIKETYSTDEVFTGKYWIDGKPIYRKTITSSSKLASGNNALQHNISNIGSHRVVVEQEYIYNNINHYGYSGAGTFVNVISIETSTVTVVVGNSWGNLFTPYVTIEYTKTTD